jgi:phosphoglycerate dehydrogenase-like enzyme
MASAGLVTSGAILPQHVERIQARGRELGAEIDVHVAATHQALNQAIDAHRAVRFLLSDMLPDLGLAPDAGTISRLGLADDRAVGSDADVERALARLDRLEWVQLTAAGVNQETASLTWRQAPGIAVTTSSGLPSVAMAQYILAAILRHANRFDRLSRYRSARDWSVRSDFQTVVLAGQTLLLLGYGGTGRRAARIAAALGMRVIAMRLSPDEERLRFQIEPFDALDNGIDGAEIIGPADLDRVLPEADYVASSLPLTASTRGLIGERQLHLMKPAAIFINVSRGAVVDETALVAALRDGRIAGAALDVFATEPLPADHPLWDIPNAMLTPHASGTHDRVSQFTTELFLANLERFLAGQPLFNVADRARGY